MLLTLAIAAILIAALLWFDRGGNRTVVAATVLESVFVPDKAADGRTRTRIRAADGAEYTVTRPGRNLLKAGDPVRAELARGRVRRLLPDAPAGPTGPA